MTRLSHHAETRLKERCGLQKKSMQRMADRAFEHGYDYSQTTGAVRTWLDTRKLANGQETTFRLYGDICYVFGYNNTLITVLHIPTELKNWKKYIKVPTKKIA